MHEDVLIFGASSRAAAYSALRSGLRPRCADYFADQDLAAVCPVVQIDPAHAAREFLTLAKSLPPSCWFYTGGFENRPGLVEQIARWHRLWGAGAKTLRTVRDPFRVAGLLHAEGIAVPAARRDSDGLPRDGSWLIKPLHSGGGRGILPLTAEHDQVSNSCYFQERIDGPSFSALYVGANQGSRLVGVTQQLIGIAGSPFAYRGSIGPWPISAALADKLRNLGQILSSASGLLGWFGVDYVLRDDDPWPVEINPRYTASLEIHELASGEGLLNEHRRVCEGGPVSDPAIGLLGAGLPTPPPGRPRVLGAGLQTPPPARPQVSTGPTEPRPRMIAKLILHAPAELVAPEIAVDANAKDDFFALRPIADLPWPGTRFDPGDPVMTLLAWGDDAAECQARLTELERVSMERLTFVQD